MSREALDAVLLLRPELRRDATEARERLLRLVAAFRPLAEEAARRAPGDPDLLFRTRMLEHAAVELEDLLHGARDPEG